MIGEAPPRLLERALLLFLAERDRETVSGDLLEEYREEQLPRLGTLRANLWYLRQAVSVAWIRLWGGSRLKQLLVFLCLFIAVAGTWLGVMENVLKHNGYAGRTVVAACIALQAVLTLVCVLWNGRPVFRGIVLIDAAVIVLFGAAAVINILRAQHFEGFVLLIGLGLMLQGAFAVAVLLRVPAGKAT